MKGANNKISANILLILCPFIPMITLYCLHFLQVQTAKTYVLYIVPCYTIIGIFFVSYMVFVYAFLIKRYYFTPSFAIIGIFELLIFLITNVSDLIFGFVQGGISIYLYGSFLSIYLLLILLLIQKRLPKVRFPL